MVPHPPVGFAQPNTVRFGLLDEKHPNQLGVGYDSPPSSRGFRPMWRRSSAGAHQVCIERLQLRDPCSAVVLDFGVAYEA